MNANDVLNRFRLDGKTAIVTGGGPGIGAHIARAYAAVGANVVVTARTPGKAEAVAEQIRRDGGKAIGLVSDAGKSDDLDAMVEAAQKEYGVIHIVFNNATQGVLNISKSPWDNDDDVWERAVAVNLLAPYKLAKKLVPAMKEAGYGSIINLLTCAAITPILPQLAYGCTKTGTQMLTRYLAKACAPEVRVNCICPGSMTVDGTATDQFERHLQSNAIKRPGRSEEVIGAALLLASSASSYTTGQTIFVEGGRTSTIS
jgi:NAD(P)-dependent dehydrogenase (short-subunit alcohol dehydrogenase family)